jgi:phage gpG-like protein
MDADALAAAVRAKAESLQARLLAKVDTNLSGGVLNPRSGALKASIVADVEAEAGEVVGRLASVGVAYAAILEYGGRTPPHDIVPVKAQALAFAGARGPVFGRRVHHPGSRIRAHGFLGRALDDMRTEILDGLKESVRAALGAT